MDLVDIECHLSGRYFASKDILKSARERSASYIQYATRVFDDFFDREVALHCTFNGSRNGVSIDGDLLASLPEEPVSVFLGTVQLLLH